VRPWLEVGSWANLKALECFWKEVCRMSIPVSKRVGTNSHVGFSHSMWEAHNRNRKAGS
jgi:hypothetical protein